MVLYSVPLAVLMDMLSTLWNLPMRKACLTAWFHRTRSEDLTRLAKQLPWDHPIARTLDHEVHRRNMAVKSCHFCWVARPGVHSFPHTLFSLVCRGVPRSRLSSNSPLAHSPLSLSSTMSIVLGSAFFGFQNVHVDFFLRFLDHPGGPTRLPYLAMGRPPYLWIRLQPLCAHDGWVDDRR